MKKIVLAIAAVAAMSVSACGNTPTQPYDQYAQQADECLSAANPQECAQFRDAGGDMSKYLVGGLAGAAAGYMLKSAMTPNGPQSYFERDPSFHGTYASDPRYARSYAYVRQPGYRSYSQTHRISPTRYPTTRVTTTTVKRGIFGGTKTKTTTTTTRPSGFGGWGSGGGSYRTKTVTVSRSFSSSRSSRRR